MALLSRADLLARRPRTERVTLPGGGDLIVRGLTGRERDAFESSFFTGRGKDRQENFDNLRARLVSLSVVDEAGKRFLSPEDVTALGEIDAEGLDAVYAVAQRLSGLSPKDVEELAGNSGTGLNGGHGSSSPSVST